MPCPYGPEGIRQIQKGGRREELKGVTGGGVKHSMFMLFFFFCISIMETAQESLSLREVRNVVEVVKSCHHKKKKNGSSCVCCTGISPGLHHPLTPSRQQFKNERSKL
ncbi:hypothetical protein CHARACLAT_014623 [Characodon lateralis]|uniref:Uncharacterized protein n=1 Tax=Characodon lateralis TaxID=208331 RepID=A0ABU7F3E3_9TELE|nr:hypothetical protein [Characodon lateralis]